MIQIIPKPYWYLRHGETDWNRQGLAQGRTDIPLNETGQKQAIEAGEILAGFFRDGHRLFDRIVSSPLSRALETATYTRDIIQAQSGVDLPLQIQDELIEVCFGIHEGTPMGEWYIPWIEKGRLLEGGESFQELTDRAIATLNTELKVGGTPLFVAHGALFRGLRAGMGLPTNIRLPNAIPLSLEPSNGIWSIAKYDRSNLII
ncbi:histidine phosphatase family protein [Gluconobacter sp. LMG 31484]|uniref:Histidine phosphatase family protein n=1 Tax=Gluconobacter vitians TaxID=2728102 RepID=A0ABR9Y5G7_9PROT|nr:histidine phosphatase family protein [Gluconobacter vitians]MBF0859172.1 histidine phosphatase family protein [Gluconobacter vitians]